MAKVTYTFETRRQARQKFTNLIGSRRVYGEIGFANWVLSERTITGTSNYHVEITLQRMYKSNGKKW